jgi:hypothetical protein
MLQRTDGISDSSLPNCLAHGPSGYPSFSNTVILKKEVTCNGPNPTCGALQNYHTAGPTRTKQGRPEFEMAVFHKRVNQNIRLESSRTLNWSLSEDYDFPSAFGSVLA